MSQQARAIADRGGVPVLFGSSSVRGSTGHNSLFLMRPEVPVSEPYRKVRLVPFAEYAPRGLPNELGPRLFDVVPGAARRTFDLDGVTIEPLICFESLFADDVRATASAAPSIIAVALNNSWFGATAGPALHNLVSARRRSSAPTSARTSPRSSSSSGLNLRSGASTAEQ